MAVERDVGPYDSVRPPFPVCYLHLSPFRQNHTSTSALETPLPGNLAADLLASIVLSGAVIDDALFASTPCLTLP